MISKINVNQILKLLRFFFKVNFFKLLKKNIIKIDNNIIHYISKLITICFLYIKWSI